MHRFLLALLLLLASPLAAPAATFKDTQHDFSLDLPADWTPLAPADLDAAVRQVSPDPDLTCFAGFEHGGSALLLISASPYPDHAAYSTLTLQQIQQIAATLSQANPGQFRAATQPISGGMGAGATRQITTCTEPPGFILDYLFPPQDLRSHSIAFLQRDRVVILHFFAKPADYAEQTSPINDIAASYRPNYGASVSLKTTFHAAGDYTTFGLYLFVGLLILAAGGVVYYLFKRQAY